MNRKERRERKGKNLFLLSLRSLRFNRRRILSCAPRLAKRTIRAWATSRMAGVSLIIHHDVRADSPNIADGQPRSRDRAQAVETGVAVERECDRPRRRVDGRGIVGVE